MKIKDTVNSDGDEKKHPKQSCAEICQQAGVFWKQLPPWNELSAELEQLQRTYGPETIAIHVAMLDQDDDQVQAVLDFLRQGKISIPGKSTVSNYFNEYLLKSYSRYPNDLVVVFSVKPGDIEWGAHPGSDGRNDGRVVAPFNSEVYGQPVRYADKKVITHIPPDRIVGIYFVQTHEEIHNIETQVR
jgi:hypothetical protein